MPNLSIFHSSSPTYIHITPSLTSTFCSLLYILAQCCYSNHRDITTPKSNVKMANDIAGMDQGLLRKNPFLTDKEFSDHWYTTHSQLVIPFFLHSGIKHYEQVGNIPPPFKSTRLLSHNITLTPQDPRPPLTNLPIQTYNIPHKPFSSPRY
jgi:hypothetical protein